MTTSGTTRLASHARSVRLCIGHGVLLVSILALTFGLAGAAGAGDGRRDVDARRCHRPLEPGLHTVDVLQNGVNRPLQIWVPTGYRGRSVPLLFWLHGSGTTGESAMATADPDGRPLFPDDADEHGYVVATPSGAIPFDPAPGISGFAWNIPGVPLVGTQFYPPPGTPDDVEYIDLAIDAIGAAKGEHHFLSVTKQGNAAIVATRGNPYCHVILRGGKAPNYDADSVAAACKALTAAHLPATLMVDCSHANSSKQHEKQLDVARNVAAQVAGGSTSVFGLMVESHLHAGAQKFTPGQDDASKLDYGKSITDACLGWDHSLELLDSLSQAVAARRKRAA